VPEYDYNLIKHFYCIL